MVKQSVALALILLALMMAIPAAAQDYVDPADLADPDGQFVEVNGAQVYYREQGPTDGPAVLLLHGFLGSTANWDGVIEELAEAGYHVIAFDRPPFGLSDKNPDLDYALTAQGDLTVGLMDALDIDTAILVGHSAGGPVIADVALRYPERVEKLVFVAAAVGLTAEDMDAEDDESEGAIGAANFMANLDPESPLAQAALRAFFNSDFAQNMLNSSYYDPEKAKRLDLERNAAGLKIKGWEAGLLAYTRDMMNDLDALDLEQLKTVDIPVLLMWGENDKTVPIQVGERLRELLPNDTWVTYPKTGHIPQQESFEPFMEDLLAFLKAS